jgi:hypothetical protein
MIRHRLVERLGVDHMGLPPQIDFLNSRSPPDRERHRSMAMVSGILKDARAVQEARETIPHRKYASLFKDAPPKSEQLEVAGEDLKPLLKRLTVPSRRSGQPIFKIMDSNLS